MEISNAYKTLIYPTANNQRITHTHTHTNVEKKNGWYIEFILKKYTIYAHNRPYNCVYSITVPTHTRTQ